MGRCKCDDSSRCYCTSGGVIAAGSVVTKSTEPNALYAGVPARKVKDLEDE